MKNYVTCFFAFKFPIKNKKCLKEEKYQEMLLIFPLSFKNMPPLVSINILLQLNQTHTVSSCYPKKRFKIHSIKFKS